MKRRGVSPVIATVMLVAIAIILAAIVFLWAQGFLAERTQKFDEPAERACGRINFEAEAISSENTLNIVNRGNVAIYGVEIRQKGVGFIKKVGVFERTISIGDSGSLELPDSVEFGNELIVVPIILGEVSGSKKAFSCEVELGKEIKVE
jgi:flagellin-like protein